MIDVPNRFAVASASLLYHSPQSTRLRPSVLVGLAIALGLHLVLIAYLITQTISPVAIAPIEPEPPFVGGIVTLSSKPLEPLKPVLDVHKPENPVLTDTPPLPATPQDDTHKTDAGPQQPALPLGGEAGSTGEASQSTTPGPVASAKWSRFPGPEALSTYYPPRALEAEVEGVAALECVVRDTQGRVSCRVLSEKPGGYGFGEATRRMIEKVGRVEMTGALAVGSTLHLSVKWSLPQ